MGKPSSWGARPVFASHSPTAVGSGGRPSGTGRWQLSGGLRSLRLDRNVGRIAEPLHVVLSALGLQVTERVSPADAKKHTTPSRPHVWLACWFGAPAPVPLLALLTPEVSMR